MKIQQYLSGKWMRLCLLILLGTASACADKFSSEEEMLPDEPTIRVTLNLSAPGVDPASTRMTNSKQIAIETLRVLVFSADDKYKYDAPVSQIVQGSYAVRLRPSTTGEAYRLVLIANMPGSVAPVVDENIATVLNKFVFQCVGTWSQESPIPMCGETDTQLVTSTVDIFKDKSGHASVLMKRALARIDVGVNFVDVSNPTSNATAGLSHFKLKSVRVYNTPNMGTIYSDNPFMPNLPTWVSGWGNNPIIPYYGMDSPMDGVCGDFFVPEAHRGGLSGMDETAPFLVIGGYYGAGNTTTETYYRANFYHANTNLTSYLIRNCLYRINITEVNASGYATVAEAVNGKTSTFKWGLIGWNQMALNHIVWNGEDYLSASTKTPKLLWETNSELRIPVSTSGILASEYTLTNSAPTKISVGTYMDSSARPAYIAFRTLGYGGATGLGANEVVTVTWKARGMKMEFRVTQAQFPYINVSGNPEISDDATGGEWVTEVPVPD